MKIKIQILATFLILFNISSCGDDLAELENLLKIDVDTELTREFKIEIDAGNNVYFIDQQTLSINDNETKKYIDQLKDVTIEKLTYKIKNYLGSDVDAVINGEFFVNNTLLLTKSINLKDASDNGTIFEITNLNDINDAASKLKNGEDINIGLRGTSDSNSAIVFDVEIFASVVLTVTP